MFRTELVNVAESVHSDTITLAPVATFGWLPGAFSVDHVGLSGNSSTSWLGHVELGTSSTEPGTGEPVTVRGHTGKLVNDTATDAPLARLILVVGLGGGTWLTLSAMNSPSASIGKEDLLRVAETLQIATPDLSWMGR